MSGSASTRIVDVLSQIDLSAVGLWLTVCGTVATAVVAVIALFGEFTSRPGKLNARGRATFLLIALLACATIGGSIIDRWLGEEQENQERSARETLHRAEMSRLEAVVADLGRVHGRLETAANDQRRLLGRADETLQAGEQARVEARRDAAETLQAGERARLEARRDTVDIQTRLYDQVDVVRPEDIVLTTTVDCPPEADGRVRRVSLYRPYLIVRDRRENGGIIVRLHASDEVRGLPGEARARGGIGPLRRLSRWSGREVALHIQASGPGLVTLEEATAERGAPDGPLSSCAVEALLTINSRPLAGFRDTLRRPNRRDHHLAFRPDIIWPSTVGLPARPPREPMPPLRQVPTD